MTMPGKPYIYRQHGAWVVQWPGVQRSVRRVRRPTFAHACRLAAIIRRAQLERESS